MQVEAARVTKWRSSKHTLIHSAPAIPCCQLAEQHNDIPDCNQCTSQCEVDDLKQFFLSVLFVDLSRLYACLACLDWLAGCLAGWLAASLFYRHLTISSGYLPPIYAKAWIECIPPHGVPSVTHPIFYRLRCLKAHSPPYELLNTRCPALRSYTFS